MEIFICYNIITNKEQKRRGQLHIKIIEKLDYTETEGTVSNAISQVWNEKSEEFQNILSNPKLNLYEKKIKIIDLVFSVPNIKKDTPGAKAFHYRILRCRNERDLLNYLCNFIAKASNGGNSVYN